MRCRIPLDQPGRRDTDRQLSKRYHRDDALPTHRHQGAYAALVINGSYVETSVDGPFLCAPGTLVVHPEFHAHGNRFGRRGARVLNVALPSLPPSARLQVLRVPSMADETPLVEVACVCGFADQSHFSRVTRGIAGMPPAALRRWIKSVQDGPRSVGC